MNTYVLIQGKQIETDWYELVEEYSMEKVEKLASKFSSGMAQQYLKGRAGLTSETMNRFLWQFIQNTSSFLKEGRVLLFNRLGGMMFLDHNVKVLKSINDHYFPSNKENGGLTGWLTPEGEFHACDYGEHWKYAAEVLNKETDYLRELQYVSMGSVTFNNLSSHLFIPAAGYTAEQEKWFESHFTFLDEEQKNIYLSTKQGAN